MTKRVLIVNPTQSTGETLLPYLWLCLRAHHTEYGVKQDVQWLPPIVNIHGHDFADIMLITRGEYQHEFKYFKTPMSPNWVKLETTTRHLLHNYKKPFWTQLCQMLGVDMTHQAVIDGMSRCDDIDTPIEL